MMEEPKRNLTPYLIALLILVLMIQLVYWALHVIPRALNAQLEH